MIRDFIFLVLFFILLGIWGVSWLAFHVAGGMIHLLLVLAEIFLVLHLFRGSGQPRRICARCIFCSRNQHHSPARTRPFAHPDRAPLPGTVFSWQKLVERDTESQGNGFDLYRALPLTGNGGVSKAFVWPR